MRDVSINRVFLSTCDSSVLEPLREESGEIHLDIEARSNDNNRAVGGRSIPAVIGIRTDTQARGWSGRILILEYRLRTVQGDLLEGGRAVSHCEAHGRVNRSWDLTSGRWTGTSLTWPSLAVTSTGAFARASTGLADDRVNQRWYSYRNYRHCSSGNVRLC